MLQDRDLVSVQQARHLIEKSQQALLQFKTFTQQQTDAVVAAASRAAREAARRLAEMAVEETGYGKIEDKTVKNLFSAVDVHEYTRHLKTCGVIGENKEKKVVDIAVPAGVIVAITPSTNPTSTAIFKIICALKGRNTIVLSPHPHAVRCTAEAARVMAEAAVKEGAPENCVGWMDEVTIEGTTELMRHRGTSLILATGGAGLVRAAYSSGKPAFGVGPGNVPAFIERTADVAKAVQDVLAGKTFDHGVLCSSEQALVCDQPLETQVVELLQKEGAYFLNQEETQRLNELIQLPTGNLNPAIVGKAPQEISRMAGFDVPPAVRCLMGRPAGVGKKYPLSMEKLSPILAFYVEDGWEAGCERCIEILQFGGLGHTMSIHSTDQKVIMEFALHKPAYRICVNTPATQGSVGLTTGVPPSMTLGCGTPGGSITSDNITPMHLINVKRLAFETRPVRSIHYADADADGMGAQDSWRISSAPSGSTDLRGVVRGVIDEYLDENFFLIPSTSQKPDESRLERGVPERAMPPAVDFVCEDDVRGALSAGRKISVHARSIITPSARELGEERGVFLWEREG